MKIDYDVLKGDNEILRNQIDACYAKECEDPSVGGISFFSGIFVGLLGGFLIGSASR